MIICKKKKDKKRIKSIAIVLELGQNKMRLANNLPREQGQTCPYIKEKVLLWGEKNILK